MLKYSEVMTRAAAFREQYRPDNAPPGVQAWLALADILESLFPEGDRDAEWDATRMDAVGAAIDSHGLRPE